jgi:hypothetical protein
VGKKYSFTGYFTPFFDEIIRKDPVVVKTHQ